MPKGTHVRTTSIPRSAAATSAALLLGTLLAPGSASAAGETCRGEAATIVSAPGSLWTDSTEARDVIVASGGVDAKGGDDLVCIVGDREGSVAGAGDDVVDTTAATGRIGTELGAGADRFYGGSGVDTVSTDENLVSVDGAGTEVDLDLPPRVPARPRR